MLLTAAAAAAQQPTVQPGPKPPAKGSVEEAILNAQRTHPDIKLAEAKVRLAEAELAQAQSQVAQRVAAAFAKLEQAKAELAPAQQFLDKMRAAGEAGQGTRVEVLSAMAQFQRTKSAVVAAELELNAAKGSGPGVPDAQGENQAAIDAGLRFLARQQAAGGVGTKPLPAGPVADMVKMLIDKPVKLDLKAADLDEALAAVLMAAGEPGLTVKLPMLGRKYLKEPPTVTFAGELPFTAAMQVAMDDINNPTNGGRPDMLMGKYDVYVREYGLLVARVEDAPKDAPTLTEFARQVRAEKGAKK